MRLDIPELDLSAGLPTVPTPLRIHAEVMSGLLLGHNLIRLGFRALALVFTTTGILEGILLFRELC